MSKIVSSTGAAVAAVAGIQAVTLHKGQHVALNRSHLAGLQAGSKVNNQLLPDLSELITCIRMQSEKFPQIAEMIALKERQFTF